MANKNNLIDRVTFFVMNQVSRRGFLKGIGASGIALLATAGIKAQDVLASIECPEPSIGACDPCFSSCVSGGQGGSCTCEDCDCDPAYVNAECSWGSVGSKCYFYFVCGAC